MVIAPNTWQDPPIGHAQCRRCDGNTDEDDSGRNETMKNMDQTRPVIFLDVDGVINDVAFRPLNASNARIRSHGYTVTIPYYMPALIRHLVEVADVYWLTTWRQRANDEIAAHLGIPHLKVLTDGTDKRDVSWKDAVAERTLPLLPGRKVYWIEDFYADLPIIKGITFVDTAAVAYKAVLTPADLPSELLVGYDRSKAWWQTDDTKLEATSG